MEGFSAGLVDEDDIYKWEVLIIGPADTFLYPLYILVQLYITVVHLTVGSLVCQGARRHIVKPPQSRYIRAYSVVHYIKGSL